MRKGLFTSAMAMLLVILPLNAQKKYSNPVYGSDFPDPTVLRAPDGTFYAYATACRCRKSTDLISWTGVNDVISRPTWNDTDADKYSLWAADGNYVDGKYIMYYACAKWGNGSRTGIGVATGTSPTKYKDVGKLFRSTEIGVTNSIDPCYVEEFDKKYLLWGSFHDLFIVELTEDGLGVKDFTPLDNPDDNPSKTRFKGATKLAGGAFEGVMIYKRGQYYYMFASVGSCCEGENSTYRTVVGRSTSLKGPYVNRQGGKLVDNQYTTIISGNDRWRGPGHNSEIVTDDEGQDWLLYHSYDMKNNCNGRLLLLDKITWGADGWPTVNDGHPSSDVQDGPVFYKGDGANISYKFTNLDLMKSNWKGWTMTASEGCAFKSGLGTAFCPLGGTKTAGSFDAHQTVEGLPNGIYEVKMQDFSSHGNVDFYVNEVVTPSNNASASGGTVLTVETTISNNFLRGTKYGQSVYGMVSNGKLTIGMRTRDELTAGQRFYVGNIQVIYREKNAEAVMSVLRSYADVARQLMNGTDKYYVGYAPSLDNFCQQAENATTDNERYNQLLNVAKTVDSIRTSIQLYDSLGHELKLLRQEIEEAKQGGYFAEEAQTACDEAAAVLQSAAYTDKKVLALITSMRQASHAMRYSYQEGDGTKENPYIIRRADQLDHMHDVLVREQMVYFAMEADVDMAGYNWQQLNSSDNSYRYWINFDGRGHIIRNLTPDGSRNYPSFFGVMCGECRNVGFVDANVVATATGAGILCGYMGHGTFKDAEGNLRPVVVENCYFTGTISSKGYVGVIGGTLNSSPITIRNVYTAVNLVGTGANSNYCSGLVGRVRTPLTIGYSYAAGSVNAPIATPIAGGGQDASTEPSVYDNVIAWYSAVDGSRANPFGFVREEDKLKDVYVLSTMKVNGEPVEADNARSHNELQQVAAKWGAPWHANPAAGNGYPILQWQYDRGDFRQLCGFPYEDGIALPNATCHDGRDDVFDLSGRRVALPTAGSDVLQKGIYIQNGRKMLVK